MFRITGSDFNRSTTRIAAKCDASRLRSMTSGNCSSWNGFIVAVVVFSVLTFGQGPNAIAQQDPVGETDKGIYLLVRSDDMGMAHAVNEACLRTVADGIARSIEVIVPSPWFTEAASMLNAHPEIDAGVHLDLTSEWTNIKWGPVSKSVPSLVDVNGHFFSRTSQEAGLPSGTGFLQSNWKIGEVERELRVQIETALRLLPNVTHLSAHMGTATSTPELRALVDHLSREYNLPLNVPGLKRTRPLRSQKMTAMEKEDAFIKLLTALKPGKWMFIEHPGLDTAEMRAIGHPGYENVAADRTGVTHIMTSPKVQQAVKDLGIKLVSYADVIQME